MDSKCDRRLLNSSDVTAMVRNIAKKMNMKNYEIIFKEEEFSGDNYLGEIVHITVKPSNNVGSQLRLILKKSTPSELTRNAIPITTFFKTEITTYIEVLPILDGVQKQNNIPLDEQFFFAKFYVGMAKEYKEAVILNDLTVDGFEMHDKLKHMDKEHIRMVLQNLGKFHACSFALRDKDPDSFAKMKVNVSHTQNYGENIDTILSQSVIKLLPYIENQNNRNKLEKFGDNVGDCVRKLLNSSLTEPFNAICHGDCWNNNFMFKYQNGMLNKMVMIDWQITRYASPVTDLVYFLALSVDEDYFNNSLEAALDTYYSSLETTLNRMGCDVAKCYPKKVFREQVESHLLFGLMLAMFVLPLVLAHREDAVNMEDSIVDLEPHEKKKVFNDPTIQRFNGLINYFAVKNYI